MIKNYLDKHRELWQKKQRVVEGKEKEEEIGTEIGGGTIEEVEVGVETKVEAGEVVVLNKI